MCDTKNLGFLLCEIVQFVPLNEEINFLISFCQRHRCIVDDLASPTDMHLLTSEILIV